MKKKITANIYKGPDLAAALDEIDVGILLLNQALHVQFINRAFVRLWNLDDDFIGTKPDFQQTLRAISARRTSRLLEQELEAYIAERIALVSAGIEDPRTIRLNQDKVIRVTCKALPDGGRMLIYTNVSDLVHHADKLEELAMTDSMTGLFNRRYFFKLAEREWERFRSTKSPLSMLMIDIDKFKSVNDRFGHDVGDRVIASVANTCRELKRSSDVVARMGGEEFAILLPETTQENASEVARRLREKVSAARILVGGKQVSSTVSLGVSEAHPKMDSMSELIRNSDQALYEAKRLGRDRVCTFAG